MKQTNSGWTASELADQTAKQVPAYCNKPTERLVRYYTSLGILDKPARIDADKRRSIYGERQLHQLLLAVVFNYAGPGAVQAHKRGYFRFRTDSPTGTEKSASWLCNSTNLKDLYHQAISPGGIAYEANALKAKVAKKGGSK